ncbi:MAG: ParB N-terminal domain-containing protein [Proteobacteria bacterium]|nr:ParB N-terminal domain-containing protein [Pseudomonadota bacterium]
MTETITIPLNKLAVWDGNVRKTGAHEALEELIASLASHGLLQSLVVRAISTKGKAKGKYQTCSRKPRSCSMALCLMTSPQRNWPSRRRSCLPKAGHGLP